MRCRLLTLYCLAIAGLLMTCRQADPEPDPLLDGSPRLKSISLSGIPQANIGIDQKANVVTVQMPPIILDKTAIVLELTENAEWVQANTYYVSPFLFGCASCFQIVLKDKTSSNGRTYTVKTIPAGPAKVALLSQPIPYAIRDERNDSPFGVDIPMVNLYGNALPKEARLVHEATGEKLVVRRDTGQSGFFGVHYSTSANKLGIYLYELKLLTGAYQIDFLLDDGTVLKVPQPLLVTKGTPDFDYQSQIYFGYRTAAGTPFTVKGYNLFEGDVSFELVDRTGKMYSVSGLVFDRYGREIQVPVPSTLPSGQYVLRVYVKGIRQSYCLRVNISRDAKEHPALGTLVTRDPADASPCSLLEPISVQRGVALFFTSNQTKSSLDQLSQHVVLKLISQTNETVYYASVLPYDYKNSGFPGSFTVPESVPVGLYTATLQVLDAQNNVVDESDPYGRLLQVQ